MIEKNKIVSTEGPMKALLLFADVIDSSVYSSTWGVVEYAKKLKH